MGAEAHAESATGPREPYLLRNYVEELVQELEECVEENAEDLEKLTKLLEIRRGIIVPRPRRVQIVGKNEQLQLSAPLDGFEHPPKLPNSISPSPPHSERGEELSFGPAFDGSLLPPASIRTEHDNSTMSKDEYDRILPNFRELGLSDLSLVVYDDVNGNGSDTSGTDESACGDLYDWLKRQGQQTIQTFGPSSPTSSLLDKFDRFGKPDHDTAFPIISSKETEESLPITTSYQLLSPPPTVMLGSVDMFPSPASPSAFQLPLAPIASDRDERSSSYSDSTTQRNLSSSHGGSQLLFSPPHSASPSLDLALFEINSLPDVMYIPLLEEGEGVPRQDEGMDGEEDGDAEQPTSRVHRQFQQVIREMQSLRNTVGPSDRATHAAPHRRSLRPVSTFDRPLLSPIPEAQLNAALNESTSSFREENIDEATSGVGDDVERVVLRLLEMARVEDRQAHALDKLARSMRFTAELRRLLAEVVAKI